MVLKIVQNYGRALQWGHAHIFQSLPRLLTLWFEAASAFPAGSRVAEDLSATMRSLSRSLPVYQWLTALPQLISRISHGNSSVHNVRPGGGGGGGGDGGGGVVVNHGRAQVALPSGAPFLLLSVAPTAN
jgi:hypothetical protein